MAVFYVTDKQSGLRVRDLRKGMRVPVNGGREATVSNAYFLDGSGGERPMLITHEGRTAVAMRVEFEDHEPLVCHPGAIVTPQTRSKT